MLERIVRTSANLVAGLTPLADALITESLEVDDNRALWASYTPHYTPLAPLNEHRRVDFAIIGGGFTGVSTAYHMSRRFPDKRIALLEAKTLANGASGRNGGMMLNWTTEYPTTDEGLQAVYRVTNEGIDTILNIIERHQLEVSYRRDGSLETFTDPARAEAAHREAEHLQSLGIPIQFLDAQALKTTIDLQKTYGAQLDPNAGQLNGAQYVRALRPVLLEQGVEIYEQSPVTKINEGREIELITPKGRITAGAILLATNGYTGKLGYFRDAIFPLHSHVFATDKLTPEQLTRIGWHSTSGYSDDYDRISYSSLTPEGHIVFGGGSNDSYDYLFRNRTAYPRTPQAHPKPFETMKRTWLDYQPGGRDLPIAHRWTGTLGITLARNNLMGVRGEHKNVYYALGYCGHGVTLANVAGEVITDLYSGDHDKWRAMPFYQPDYVRIPPEPFRWLGYQVFTRATGKAVRA